MTEAFKWNLSPTERRIAEAAFGELRSEPESIPALARKTLVDERDRLRGLVEREQAREGMVVA